MRGEGKNWSAHNRAAEVVGVGWGGGARGEVGEGLLLLVTSLLCWLEPRDCQPAPNYEEVAQSKEKKITCPPAL